MFPIEKKNEGKVLSGPCVVLDFLCLLSHFLLSFSFDQYFLIVIFLLFMLDLLYIVLSYFLLWLDFFF